MALLLFTVQNVPLPFIANLKATIDYAKPNLSAKIEGTEDDDSDDGDEQETPPPAEKEKDRAKPPAPRRQLEGNMKEFTFPLPSGTVAIVQVPHPMPKADFDIFLEFLGVYKKAMIGDGTAQTQIENPPSG